MKIYNKKKFVFGIVWLSMMAFMVIMDVVKHEFDVNGVVTVLVGCLLGVDSLARSLSRKLTAEDRLEEQDERNQLIELKTKRRAFQIMQGMQLAGVLIFIAMGSLYDETNLTAMGAGCALLFTLSLGVSFFTEIYYERKN